MRICDWADLAPHCDALLARIDLYQRVASPFHVLSLPSTPAQQRKAAEIVLRHDDWPVAAQLEGWLRAKSVREDKLALIEMLA